MRNSPNNKISIHALLAESDRKGSCGCVLSVISIHALLAESDRGRRVGLPVAGHFYPRSPCGERLAQLASLKLFVYFYPRSPCGERLSVAV